MLIYLIVQYQETSNDLAAAADRGADFMHAWHIRRACGLSVRLNEPAYSQQAAIVEAEGLIRRRRDAQSNRYSIALPAVPAQAKLLHKLSCPHAPRI